jgi:hypothetical protein
MRHQPNQHPALRPLSEQALHRDPLANSIHPGWIIDFRQPGTEGSGLFFDFLQRQAKLDQHRPSTNGCHNLASTTTWRDRKKKHGRGQNLRLLDIRNFTQYAHGLHAAPARLQGPARLIWNRKWQWK